MPASNAIELPPLPLAEWQDTQATLHMWMQIIGKIQLALTPLVNHWWNVSFFLTARGMETQALHYAGGTLEISSTSSITTSCLPPVAARCAGLPLRPQTVADFYREVMQALSELGVGSEDLADAGGTRRSHRLREGHRAPLLRSRSGNEVLAHLFLGRRGAERVSCPLHRQVEPGAFLLGKLRSGGHALFGTLVRLSVPGADPITREAYSHEVSSAGLWPGGGAITGPAFYSYAAPEPAGFAEQRVQPAQAFYDPRCSRNFC